MRITQIIAAPTGWRAVIGNQRYVQQSALIVPRKHRDAIPPCVPVEIACWALLEGTVKNDKGEEEFTQRIVPMANFRHQLLNPQQHPDYLGLLAPNAKLDSVYPIAERWAAYVREQAAKAATEGKSVDLPQTPDSMELSEVDDGEAGGSGDGAGEATIVGT